MFDSWDLSMRARNLATKTRSCYLEAATQLVDLALVADVADLTRTHVQEYLADQAATRAPATVSLRFRALQQFFKWLTAEGEIDANPMVGLDPPEVPEVPVPVISHEDMRLMLKTCDGKEFADRRDAAMIRLFLDGGVRLSELAGINVDDVDLRGQTVRVLGKGRRERVVPFGVKVAQSIDRYTRLRVRHTYADHPALWLGAKGKAGLTPNGVYQMVRRRARAVGLEIHPHQFRHTFAHQWLAEGGTEGDLMMLTGWRSRSMLDRYGKSAAGERARNAHRTMSLGDRL